MKDYQPYTKIPSPPVPPGPSVSAPTLSQFSLGTTFAALKYRNYRLWFAGQLISVIGTWMQSTAQGFLVYQLTHSPAYLGYVGFAAGVPSWLFMLYGGVVADRVSRRKLLITTQSTMMVLAFILCFLSFSGLVQPWHIVILALGLGVANAFDAPARQSFILEMVERKDLANAIALNSTMFNSAAVVGPAVAGLAYMALGPSWCFALNGLSFLAVIAALSLMRFGPTKMPPRGKSALEDLKEGLQYTLTHPVIRTLIFLAGASSIFGLAFVTLMPAWAVTILKGGAGTNGLMQSSRALGALLGALMIASMGSLGRKGRWLTIGQFVYPCLLLVFSVVRQVPFSLAALLGVGWGLMILFNLLNTLVQTLVPDALRGRVMSIYTLTFFGCMPLGSLLAGILAERWGAPLTVMMTASASLLVAVVLWWRRPNLWEL